MSVYAILKSSYHWVPQPLSPDPNIFKPIAKGGFHGSAFFVNDSIAISAYHVINENTFTPEYPHTNAQLWLVSDLGVSYEIKLDMLDCYPHLDITIIRFYSNQIGAKKLQLNTDFVAQSEIFNAGYPNFGPPNVQLEVYQSNNENPKLRISGADLRSSLYQKSGYIKSIAKESVNKNDIKLNNVEIIRTNYGGKRGMSGSPLIKHSDRTVIGVMSHGYPEDVVDKDELCAISVREFINLI